MAAGPQHIWCGVSSKTAVRAPACGTFRVRQPLCVSCRSNRCSDDSASCDLNGIDWVIVGGESGPGARPMHEDWVLDIRDQCDGARIPFFFKQWGGVRKKRNGRLLDGRTYDEYPQRVVSPIPGEKVAWRSLAMSQIPS